MRKNEFLASLCDRLQGLPQEDIEECLTFYGEMIDDRIEEGNSEEEAVRQMGSADEIVRQTLAEIPLVKLVGTRVKPKRTLRAWEIALIAVGAPVWLPLIVAAFAVGLSLYAVLWSVIVSLWSVFASLVGCIVGGVASGVLFICLGNTAAGLAMLSAGLVCAGLSVFGFFGCKAATKSGVWLTKRIALGIKKLFIKKERAL